MNCQRVLPLVSEFHDGLLPEAEAAAVRAHLASCASCKNEYATLAALLDGLASMPEETPPPGLSRAFARALEAQVREERRASRPRPFLAALLPFRLPLQAAAAVLLVASGFYAGGQHQVSVQREDDTRRELAQLREKVDLMARLVPTASSLDKPASARLLQASLTTSPSTNDDTAQLAQLLGSMAFDPSTNVRLCALEALYSHASRPIVRQGILAALPRERSPLVQLAMIDFLSTVQEPRSAEVLNTLLRDEATDKIVKSAAKLALTRL